MIERIPDWFKERWNLIAVCVVATTLLIAWVVTLGVLFEEISITNSSASLIATTTTATLTGFYALLTYSLFRESIRNRHHRVAPAIVIDSGSVSDHLGPVVRNVGNGPAIRLKIIASLEPNGPTKEISGEHLRVNGVIDLGVVDESFAGLGQPDEEEYGEFETLTVEVEYVSNTGRDYSYTRKKGLEQLRKEREQFVRVV